MKVELPNGKIADVNKFVVTGVLFNSKKRFIKFFDGTFEGFKTATSINLWRGTVWGVGETTGKRIAIRRTYN